jgi:hypothetical protein
LLSATAVLEGWTNCTTAPAPMLKDAQLRMALAELCVTVNELPLVVAEALP